MPTTSGAGDGVGCGAVDRVLLRELMRAHGVEKLLDDDADVAASDVLAALRPTHRSDASERSGT